MSNEQSDMAESNELQLDEFNQALGDEPMSADAGGGQANPVGTEGTPETLKTLYDIPVNITAVLGRTHIEVNNLLELGTGDIVELDRKVGEAIDIYVNNRLVARGEVVLVENRLGITMTEIIKTNQFG